MYTVGNIYSRAKQNKSILQRQRKVGRQQEQDRERYRDGGRASRPQRTVFCWVGKVCPGGSWVSTHNTKPVIRAGFLQTQQTVCHREGTTCVCSVKVLCILSVWTLRHRQKPMLCLSPLMYSSSRIIPLCSQYRLLCLVSEIRCIYCPSPSSSGLYLLLTAPHIQLRSLASQLPCAFTHHIHDQWVKECCGATADILPDPGLFPLCDLGWPQSATTAFTLLLAHSIRPNTCFCTNGGTVTAKYLKRQTDDKYGDSSKDQSVTYVHKHHNGLYTC